MSINKVTLLGNVGHTPEIREHNGSKFATMRLATTERGFTKKDGTQVAERTEWHSLIVNGGLVSVVERYVSKGSKLYVEGKLRTRKYTGKDNTEKQVTEIYVDTLELLGSPQQQPESNPNVPFENQQRSQQQQWLNNGGGSLF